MPSRRSFAAVTVASVIVAGVIILVIAQRNDSGYSSGGGDPPAGGPRTGVEWCVDVASDDNIRLQLEAKQEIEKLLPIVAADEEAWHRRFAKPPGSPFASRLPNLIESSCPTGPAVYTSGDYGLGRRVSSPGRFSLLIYVLPEGHIELEVGRNGYRLASEEHQCLGDECDITADGLYLAEEEVADSALIKYWLYEAIGLGCYRPADALLPFQTPPPGSLNPSEYCNESYDP